jgi:hypothetical protein
MSALIPPPLIESARVLQYAIVDAGVRYTACSVLYVGGVELGPVPRLAVCRNLADDSVVLLHCDDEWSSLGCSGSGSVDEVLAHANRLYDGIALKWQVSPHSEVEVVKALVDEWGDFRCSFCGRYPFELGEASWISGEKACICSRCVERLHTDLLEHSAGAEAIDDQRVA